MPRVRVGRQHTTVKYPEQPDHGFKAGLVAGLGQASKRRLSLRWVRRKWGRKVP